MDTPDPVAVERYLVSSLIPADAALERARSGSGLPDIEVSPTTGKLLHLLARLAGARRVLEFGTLAGYSTIWLARAVGPDGRVTTLELLPRHAEIARENLAAAGVGDRVEVVVGPALDSARALTADGVEPYDLVFIDADKRNNTAYVVASLAVLRPGGLLVVDNVVRDGRVVDAASDDPDVRGVRDLIAFVGAEPRLEATALQTVGVKGWDGLLVARFAG